MHYGRSLPGNEGVSRRSAVVVLAVAIISLMTLSGVILAVIVAVRGEGSVGLGRRVALLEVEGLISDDEELLRQIRRLRDDVSVRAFVVAVNSPGGVVGPSQSIYRELKRIRDEDKRPVIASIGAVGASGGYYVSLAADSIFVLPGSITGSIGVIMEFPDASELMRKVGVGMQVVKSAEHKDVGSPFRPMSREDRAILVSLVEDVYRQFVEVVEAERRLTPEAVRAIADGRVLSGRQAIEHGLVDRIGNVHDALAAAGRMAGLGDDPNVVRPPRDDVSLLDAILGRATTRAVERLVRPLDEAVGPRLKYVVSF